MVAHFLESLFSPQSMETVISGSQLFTAATLMTLGLALASLALGLLLATAFALGELSRFRPLAWLSTSVVTVLRGLPEILVVFFIYFGATHALFLLTGDYVEVSPFTAGVIALSLIYSSYASQTLRGALMAVPKGQSEAVKALGIKPVRGFFKIVLPQAWRHALPGLGNQWLVLLKDTALVALIGVNELLKQAQLISSRTYEPFTWYAVAAVIYLLITLLSQHLLQRMRKQSSQYLQEAPL